MKDISEMFDQIETRIGDDMRIDERFELHQQLMRCRTLMGILIKENETRLIQNAVDSGRFDMISLKPIKHYK